MKVKRALATAIGLVIEIAKRTPIFNKITILFFISKITPPPGVLLTK